MARSCLPYPSLHSMAPQRESESISYTDVLLVLRCDALWNHTTYPLPSYLFDFTSGIHLLVGNYIASVPVWGQCLLIGSMTVLSTL